MEVFTQKYYKDRYHVPSTICSNILIYLLSRFLFHSDGCDRIHLGAVHSGGLIVSQAWLTTEAREAPEFGNSLFVSFSNLGIAIGTTISGWFISHFGIPNLIWVGIAFSLLAFILIMVKIQIYKLNTSEVNIR